MTLVDKFSAIIIHTITFAATAVLMVAIALCALELAKYAATWMGL